MLCSMPADHLRIAAGAIRESEADAFHLAVADWLDHVASRWTRSGRTRDDQQRALAIAHSYLGWG